MTEPTITAYRVPAPECVRVDRVSETACESWGFVVSDRRGLALLDYTITKLGDSGAWGPSKWWDGMAAQNGPRSHERVPRPKTIPEEVAIAAWRLVGYPSTPPVEGYPRS